jgi:competence protein ComEA
MPKREERLDMIRRIPTIVSLIVTLAVIAPVARMAAETHQAGSQTANAALNLNTATQSELEKLPGVGPATARQIIEYRQKNNGFKKVEELMNIKGIGEKSFLKLKPLVTVAPPKVQER